MSRGARHARFWSAAGVINQVSNLEIFPLALSNNEREGHLAFGTSSELNMLAESGPANA